MEENQIDEPTKPGQYLAYEREKKGFTIEDIARKLCLSSHIIRSLEAEAYDELPELVYVRGYIRSYCRLLRIDPVSVLDMYTVNLPREEEQLLEDLSPSSPVNERHQKLIMIWGSIAVLSIFLILIIGWWQENQLATISLNEPPILQEKVTPPMSDSKTAPIEPASPPLLEPIEIEIKKVVRENNSLDERTHSAEFNTEEVVQENDNADGLSSDVPTLETTNDSDFNTEVDTESDSRQFKEIDDMPQLVTLVVMSRSESWARVKDGGGEIFIHRILPADYNKIFMVNLPLKFELGNAHQVSIMIEGKDYDFSSHIKPNKVATFEVSELP